MAKSWRIATVFAASLGLFGLSAVRATAQNGGRMEVGANYSYVRTNAPPAGCGCFSMNGGSGWFGYNFGRSLGLVGEVGGDHASNISGTAADLTLTSYLVGPRYSWHRGNRIVPFGQFLLGGAHASGALTPETSGLAGSANAFAMAAGGGVDVRLASHWAVRAVQVDYYLTRFPNGVNDHQNNLRIGAGIVFRF